MITRLYANNFRCLVAFEAQFDSFGVLCGPNGAGKSSVIDVLKLLRDLATGDAYLGGEGEKDVRELEFTKWLNITTQEFELKVTAEGHEFQYQLHLQQVVNDEKPRVIHERATCDSTARTVVIDEPDNYVGLPELQPWVLSMRELLDEEHQAILISHHPEILGNAGGRWNLSLA